jgi:hypothetical protein
MGTAHRASNLKFFEVTTFSNCDQVAEDNGSLEELHPFRPISRNARPKPSTDITLELIVGNYENFARR